MELLFQLQKGYIYHLLIHQKDYDLQAFRQHHHNIHHLEQVHYH